MSGRQQAPNSRPNAASPEPVIVNLDSYRELARRKLSSDLFDYIDGGAGDELTCAANSADLSAIRLTPLAFRNVAQLDLRWSGPLGEFSLPMGFSPSAFHCLVHDDGEFATASAAKAIDVPMVLSMMSSLPLEEVAVRSGHSNLWLQTYLLKDRGFGLELAGRARVAGFKAIVVSAGCAEMGRRDRNIANAFALPEHIGAGNFRRIERLDHNNPIHSFDGASPDPAACWDDLAEFVAAAGLPVIIKGMLNPVDVEPALAAGVSGLIVSNHGGRQLDSTISTIRALPAIAELVAGRVPLLIDSGFRRGTDLVKALALGADAVLLGRAVMWALAVNGREGVETSFRLLADELANAMRLVGCSTIADLRANASTILRG